MTFKNAYKQKNFVRYRSDNKFYPEKYSINNDIKNFSIYIITLPKRINYVKKMIKKYNFRNICNNVRIINAVLKKDINLNDSKMKRIISLSSLNERRKKSVNQSILGQLGCYLSHLKSFEIFLKEDRNDNLLILEDDFIFEKGIGISDFKNIINKLINDKFKFDIINVGCCWRNCKKDIKINDYLVEDFGKCTHSIFSNRRGIKNVLKFMYPIDMALDDKYSYLTKNRRIIGYSLDNRLFDQNSLLESNIQSRTLTPKCL